MTDREHAEAAHLIVLAESEGPEARKAAMRLIAGIPPADVKAIEAKVAELKAGVPGRSAARPQTPE